MLQHFIEFVRRQESLEWAAIVLAFHVCIQLAVSLRVVMQRRAIGETLAWLMLVFVLPVVGSIIYLLLGELRLGVSRGKRMQEISQAIRDRMTAFDRPGLQVNWHALGDDCEQLATAAQRLLRVPALPGNELELLDDWQKIFDRVIEDINAAEVSCDLEFYIWHNGGQADEVVAALERAAQRGVACRILVDALGSRKFLRSRNAKRLKDAGVTVQSALPGGLWRLLFVRFDLRLHRKLILIDDRIGYTGSLNLVDPRYFKQNAGVGQWIDAMVRVQGPVVEALAISFQSDWYVEHSSTSGELPDLTTHTHLAKRGVSAVQVLPSGPTNQVQAIEQLVLLAIYSARHEVIITTPYFVPSEALEMALISAAQRGVKVIVVVPAKVDSMLVRFASRAYKGDLLLAGVHIAQFHGGLLHTKSIVIDKRFSFFGSLNMDPRSFRLNFELTLAVYDSQFATELRELQQAYLNQSELMDLQRWLNRSIMAKLLENVARLLGPLL